jgi:DNA-directed RNA polymerase subunit beta
VHGLNLKTDRNDLVWVRVDKTRKIPAHVFLKAMGLSDNDIYNGLRHPEYLKKHFVLKETTRLKKP